MYKRSWIVLSVLANKGYTIQRELARITGYSLGAVNIALKDLISEGYITEDFVVTKKAYEHIERNKPKRAIILAAGAGLRMAPENGTPKGLLVIGGRPLIERIIEQLNQVGIKEINIVVGYKMEQFEYLSEKYGANLIVNELYAERDSLHSLALAADHLTNSYVVNSDLWFTRNPFCKQEYFPWYAVSNFVDDDSFVRVNRKLELIYTEEGAGNGMIGLGYINGDISEQIKTKLLEMDAKRKNQKSVWENALFVEDKMVTFARIMNGQNNFAVKTFEQFLEVQWEIENSINKCIDKAGQALGVSSSSIKDVTVSRVESLYRFIKFRVNENKYILREPLKGSVFADWKSEKEIYSEINGMKIADDVVSFDGDTGIKISKYSGNAEIFNLKHSEDIKKCIELLRSLHSMKVKGGKVFDPFQRIARYEEQVEAEKLFIDYKSVRSRVMELKEKLLEKKENLCLCNVNTITSNFICSSEGARLIGWEYAGVCDPLVDIATFCTSAGFDQDGIVKIAEMYYGELDDEKITRLYAYCAVCSLLQSLKSEHWSKFGVSSGGNTLKQFQNARKYVALADYGFMKGSAV